MHFEQVGVLGLGKVLQWFLLFRLRLWEAWLVWRERLLLLLVPRLLFPIAGSVPKMVVDGHEMMWLFMNLVPCLLVTWFWATWLWFRHCRWSWC
jgi:hypothetical protein